MTINEAGSRQRGPYAKTAERRRAIIAAAHTVFAAQGYRGGSLQDVANLVGMSQTSLLYYFPSKSDLLLGVLNWRDSITGDGSVPRDPDEEFVDSVIRQARHNENFPGVVELYTVLCAESLTDAHPGRDFFVRRFERLRESYTRKFAELEQTGRLRTGVDPARAAASLVALWDGIQTQWLLDRDSVDVAQSLQDYFDLVIEPE
jgi:AcrR family transcriptional regulator